MSRLSQNQKRRRRDLDEQMSLGMLPSQGIMFPIGRYREAEITKENVHYHSDDRIREDSPLGEAAPSRSSLTKSRDLAGVARSVFPARRKLYSVDVLGRRSEIDTQHMSESAYQRLLEAFQNPVRLDDPAGTLQVVSEPARELPEGCKLGPKMGLPLPEWWELPDAEATREEVTELIRRNMERAAHKGKSSYLRRFPAG